MPRLATGRDRYLTPEEIAGITLAQFDHGARQPSIRRLAAELGVSPTAIYHHFPAQSQIIGAAVDLVWNESEEELFRLLPNPFDPDIDPVEVVVASGVATRRAFMRHFRLAPFAAATPLVTSRMETNIEFLAYVFGRMGLTGDDAGRAFHAFSSYVLGTVIFAATRAVANEQLGPSPTGEVAAADASPGEAHSKRGPQGERRQAMEDMVDLSVRDPDRDEELFADGLRRLMNSFQPA